MDVMRIFGKEFENNPEKLDKIKIAQNIIDNRILENTYIHYGCNKEEFDNNRQFLVDAFYHKPVNAFWACPLLENETSEWKKFLESESELEKDITKHITFRINESARILNINSFDILDKYIKQRDLKFIKQYYIDFAEMSLHYDGFYISKSFINKCKEDYDSEKCGTVWGYDVTSLVLFNSKFVDIIE